MSREDEDAFFNDQGHASDAVEPVAEATAAAQGVGCGADCGVEDGAEMPTYETLRDDNVLLKNLLTEQDGVIERITAERDALVAADDERKRVRALHTSPGGWLPRHCLLLREVYNQRWRSAFELTIEHLNNHSQLWKERILTEYASCHLYAHVGFQ